MIFAIKSLEGASKVSFGGIEYDVQQPTTVFDFPHFLVPLSVVKIIERLGHRFEYAGPADADAITAALTSSVGAPSHVAVPGAFVPSALGPDVPGLVPGQLEAMQNKPATGLPGDPTPARAAAKSVDAPGEAPPAKKA